jgi:O-acetyl-ADP-ribose deacetylase (regulator of RNase III)
MKIEFCIPNKAQCAIAQAMFADISDILVSNTSITNCIYPVIISAGNSFAEMNGGVDGLINGYLSGYTPTSYIQDDVKEHIATLYAGELPVGQSIVIPTRHPRVHGLIYTPTMRVAEEVGNTINAYLAFRGALTAMRRYNIQAASAPLFCTGAGAMDTRTSCFQMKEAYLSVQNGTLIGKGWKEFHAHHRYLQKPTG